MIIGITFRYDSFLEADMSSSSSYEKEIKMVISYNFYIS
jgi:hypothetical protein